MNLSFDIVIKITVGFFISRVRERLLELSLYLLNEFSRRGIFFSNCKLQIECILQKRR